MVMRVHHALGDGISLMSMLLTCCRKASDSGQLPTIGGGVGESSKSLPARKRRLTLGKMVKVLWYTLVFVLEFIMRCLWLKDKRTAMRGGAGVELWPRKLATAKFSLNDMKTVKRALPNLTINDVLMGIISSGFCRYLDIRSQKVMQEGTQITGVAMFNLRRQNGPQDFSNLTNDNKGTRFGNQFGIILVPVYYHKSGGDPLQYVKRAKAMTDKKKLSLEGPFSYKIGSIAMALFGSKVAGLLNYRIMCNTTFTLSNIIGPQEEITLTGNPVTYMKVNSTSLPHALTMHMLSYAGRAEMQILVAKDIIHDPKLLAKCFEDSLLDMKEAAVSKATKTTGDSI